MAWPATEGCADEYDGSCRIDLESMLAPQCITPSWTSQDEPNAGGDDGAPDPSHMYSTVHVYLLHGHGCGPRRRKPVRGIEGAGGERMGCRGGVQGACAKAAACRDWLCMASRRVVVSSCSCSLHLVWC